MATKVAGVAAEPQAAAEGTRIKWDDANTKSAHANVCNATEYAKRFGGLNFDQGAPEGKSK